MKIGTLKHKDQNFKKKLMPGVVILQNVCEELWALHAPIQWETKQQPSNCSLRDQNGNI